MLDEKLLGIYLNDHLAGSTAVAELARRSESSNRDSELGRFLAGLVGEIESDRGALISVMSRVGVRPDRAKQAFAWTGEKVGRLKLNGSLISYSPLSRVNELEAMILGVSGKACLWRTLGRAAQADERLADFDFGSLLERAESQLARLEGHRARAIEQALVRAGAGSTRSAP